MLQKKQAKLKLGLNEDLHHGFDSFSVCGGGHGAAAAGCAEQRAAHSSANSAATPNCASHGLAAAVCLPVATHSCARGQGRFAAVEGSQGRISH